MTRSRTFASLALVALTLLAIACQPLSPEEDIERRRGLYTATLNSFTVEEPESAVTESEMPEGEEEAVAAGEEESGAEGEGEEEAEAMAPEPSRVVLDILLSTEAMEYLPGVTLDISQVDASQSEKNHWRVYIDTEGVIRGPGTQITEVLEDVMYEEGDGFHVEVRSPLPVEERSEYREFEAAGGE